MVADLLPLVNPIEDLVEGIQQRNYLLDYLLILRRSNLFLKSLRSVFFFVRFQGMVNQLVVLIQSIEQQSKKYKKYVSIDRLQILRLLQFSQNKQVEAQLQDYCQLLQVIFSSSLLDTIYNQTVFSNSKQIHFNISQGITQQRQNLNQNVCYFKGPLNKLYRYYNFNQLYAIILCLKGIDSSVLLIEDIQSPGAHQLLD